MQYTLQELKQHWFSRVYEVYGIFKDFFGEAYVDLQGLPPDESYKEILQNYTEDGIHYNIAYTSENPLPATPFILVWWPAVTVTNEYGKSVDIQDLFAKIVLNCRGEIPDSEHGFRLNRSTYSLTQYKSDYLHSHISSIPRNPAEFQRPCLGRGPIQNTIHSLKGAYDPDLWMLFCQELSMYVTVESLAGIPYKKLESIGGTKDKNQSFSFRAGDKIECSSYDTPSLNDYKNFIYYYLKNGNLKFSFHDGCFSIGMSCYDFLVDISNSFIDYFNKFLSAKYPIKKLFYYGIIERKTVCDGFIYSDDSTRSYGPPMSNIGRHVCWFKGQDITLKVFNNEKKAITEKAVILNFKLATAFLQAILTILNFRYNKNKKDNEHSTQNQSDKPGDSSPSPCQAVRYI